MFYSFDSVALQPRWSLSLSVHRTRVSWKNRLEELGLSCKSRFCVSVSVRAAFTQACACLNVHICCPVSLFYLLAACMLCKSAIVVTGVDARLASCVALCARMACVQNSSCVQARGSRSALL